MGNGRPVNELFWRSGSTSRRSRSLLFVSSSRVRPVNELTYLFFCQLSRDFLPISAFINQSRNLSTESGYKAIDIEMDLTGPSVPIPDYSFYRRQMKLADKASYSAFIAPSRLFFKTVFVCTGGQSSYPRFLLAFSYLTCCCLIRSKRNLSLIHI